MYEWLEEVMDAMANSGLHKEYDMAFPAIEGYYDEDGLDMEDTSKMVYRKFHDSDKQLDFHVDIDASYK